MDIKNLFGTVKEEEISGNSENSNIYKIRLKDSILTDGHYRATIRIIPDPEDITKSIHSLQTYYLQNPDNTGTRVISPLTIGDKTCKIFTAWKHYRYSQDEKDNIIAQQFFSKKTEHWTRVYIVEDKNHPEYENTVMVMKLPASIYTKCLAASTVENSKNKIKFAISPICGVDINIDACTSIPGSTDPKLMTYEHSELAEYSSPFVDKETGKSIYSEAEIASLDSLNTMINAAATKAAKGTNEKSIFEINLEIEKTLGTMTELIDKTNAWIKKECENIVLPDYTPWDEVTNAKVDSWLEYVATTAAAAKA